MAEEFGSSGGAGPLPGAMAGGVRAVRASQEFTRGAVSPVRRWKQSAGGVHADGRGGNAPGAPTGSRAGGLLLSGLAARAG